MLRLLTKLSRSRAAVQKTGLNANADLATGTNDVK